MEEIKESLPSYNTSLDEKSQFEYETVINNKLPPKDTSDSLNTLEETCSENNELSNVQNERIDFVDGGEYTKANNDLLNKESACINIKEIVHSESTLDSKETSYANNNDTTLNKNVDSDISSSDEEVLQSRQPVQNNVYEDDENKSSTKSASFASISDEESTGENDSKIQKRPIIIQATVYSEEKSANHKTSDSSSEINKQAVKRSEHEEAVIGKINCNSPIKTGSNYIQMMTENDLNFDESRETNETPPQEEIMENEKNSNQNSEEINDLYTDTIFEDFFNGSFDVSAFKPVKKSTMIKDDKMITDQYQQLKEKQSPNKERKSNRNANKKKDDGNKKILSLLNHNNEAEQENINKFFANSSADLTVQFKRKTLEKKTENNKKVRTRKSKNETSNVSPGTNYTSKIKNRPENKYSRAKNQCKRSKQLNYYEEDKTVLNKLDKKEEYNKKNRKKTNVEPTKIYKNEENFTDFSCNIVPFKSRNLRNSSLIASKKIKEIKKLENSESSEEILLDSDTSYYNFSIERIDDCIKGMLKDCKNAEKCKQEDKLEKDAFHKEDMDIILLDIFQPFSEKEEKLESKKASRSNRKRKDKSIHDACYITEKQELKGDNVTTMEENFILDTNVPDFFEKEKEETYKMCLSRKKVDNKQKSKNNRTENKLLAQDKIYKFTPRKSDTTNMNYGITTRSKAKTWDMLEKELLGETKDTSHSNNVTKSLLIKEQVIKKQNTKDVELYSISDISIMQAVSTPLKRRKFDEKQDLQVSEKSEKSNEIVAYNSKNIVEKTIAAMEKCTARFIGPKKHISEKERIYSGLEFDDVIYDMDTDHEAEFHSNLTFVANKDAQYYKNKIVTVLKQSSSKKNEASTRNATRATYKSRKYKQDFNDAEHLVQRSIVTESYSIEDKAKENLKTERHTLILPTDKKQDDPWSRLIQELNLEQCNNDNKNKGELSKKPVIYDENLKQSKDQNKDGEQQHTVDLKKREFYKQNETENEDSEPEILEQFAFDKALTQSNCTTMFSDMNIEDSYTNSKFSKYNTSAELSNAYKTKNTRKSPKKSEIKEKEIQKSMKYQIQVEDDGRMKFKQCNRSLSSSSEESVKQKRKIAKRDLLKNQQKSGKEKYKRYLNKMFEKKDLFSKEKIRDNERTMESKKEEQSLKNLFKDKATEQRKINKLLLAKNDDDVFSLSSSDSEAVNKGTGLLCDMFDE